MAWLNLARKEQGKKRTYSILIHSFLSYTSPNIYWAMTESSFNQLLLSLNYILYSMQYFGEIVTKRQNIVEEA